MKKEVIFIFLLMSIFALEVEAVDSPNIPKDCTNQSLESLWDSIFSESSVGVVINVNDSYNEGGGCPLYFMYKTKDNEKVWFLWGSEMQFFFLKMQIIEAIYLEGKAEIVDMIINASLLNPQNSGKNITSYLLDLINNRTITSLGEASNEFVEKFNRTGKNWITQVNGSMVTYSFNETNEVGNLSETVVGAVFANETLDLYVYTSVINLNWTDNNQSNLKFEGEIKDLVFERNSSWNYAFNVSDYFKPCCQTREYKCIFSDNNLNGQDINCSIDSEGKVKFMPRTNFLGTRQFKIKVSDGVDTVYSNWFNVSIVEHINHAPQLIKQFPLLTIFKNTENFTVNLDEYFFDPDGDFLTFRTTKPENISVNLEQHFLILSPDKNFTGLRKIWIYANDSQEEISSGKVDIIVSEKIIHTSKNDAKNNTKNSAPIIIDYNSVNNLNFKEEIKFYVNVSDPENDSLIYRWYLDGQEISGNSNYKTFSDLKEGDHVVEVKISDGQNIVNKIWSFSVTHSNKKYFIFYLICIFLSCLILIVIYLIIRISLNKDNGSKKTGVEEVEFN